MPCCCSWSNAIRFTLLVVLLVTPLFAQNAAKIELIPHVEPDKAIAGTWQRTGAELRALAATSSRIVLPYQPPREYDVEVTFTRTSGVHSIAIILPVGAGQATFEVDAWGMHLGGFQSIQRQDMRGYVDRTSTVTLVNGRRYRIKVEVRADSIRGYLDDQMIMQHRSDGSDLSVVPAWRLPDTASLGIGAYQAATTFHSIAVQPIGGSGRLAAAGSPSPSATQDRTASAPAMKRPGAPATGNNATVLLVIANHHFFYREYADPKQELERRGHRVVVAAGHRRQCVPHPNSGQTGSGVVMPDVSLSQVNPSDYDAIVFSGGWGSSMYQYAFQGRYHTPQYNGEPDVKATVNRLLTEFHRQDKYIGGICHGTSVLAWSRVNGQSLLRGKRATAPSINGPAGIYDGRRAQPPSRWNAQQNGANLVPPGSIGNANSPADDVMVDGRILTAEDDRSARHFGIVLADLLR